MRIEPNKGKLRRRVLSDADVARLDATIMNVLSDAGIIDLCLVYRELIKYA